ncbi:hypothetical protein MPL1_07877 [Methylophaga lonarensis MPL]|uniref:Uncharacterized protein n=1 Tax=Methylophaga lonarensis MPL TaxID=1286106 RepID=M7P080_9GAMM|nr:hypothetical protein MPL1_07877 [Methylophaga lonarensis MPL]
MWIPDKRQLISAETTNVWLGVFRNDGDASKACQQFCSALWIPDKRQLISAEMTNVWLGVFRNDGEKLNNQKAIPVLLFLCVAQ